MRLNDKIDEFVYDNVVWHRQSGRKYFRSVGTHEGELAFENSFHRYIYMKTNKLSSIPKGFYIHHIDGDAYNNDPSNLEMVNGSLHSSLHMKGKPKSLVTKQKISKAMIGNHNRDTIESRLKAKKTKQRKKLIQYLNS